LNGSGKTTLLKSLAHILKPQCGEILFDNINIADLHRGEIAKIIGYMPQKSEGESVSVFDALLLGRKPYVRIVPSTTDIQKVQEVVHFLKLEDIIYRDTSELSGGELQKVLIGRVLVQSTKIMLLDEPINHLDIKNQIMVMNLIKEIVKQFNIIAIIVIHDINIALRFSDKFILLADKRLYASGDHTIITPETIKDVFHTDVVVNKSDKFSFVVPII